MVIINGRGCIGVVTGGTITINGQTIGGSDLFVPKEPTKTMERDVSSFSGIDLHVPANVIYTTNNGLDKPSLKITAPADLIPLIKTTVEGGVLRVELERSVNMNSAIRIEASSSALQSIRAAGSGTVSAKGLKGDRLKIKVSGSAEITASGTVDKVTVGISGSAEVDVSEVIASEVEIDVSGSARVDAHATTTAEVDLSGSASVCIRGNPTNRNVCKSGSGRVSFK